MVVFDIYSKRQKQLRGELPDVYQYDNLPQSFRIQVVHILRDVLGRCGYINSTDQWYREVHKILATEYGQLRLHGKGRDNEKIIVNFLLEAPVEKVLDLIEVVFFVANKYRRIREEVPDIVINFHKSAAELNARFGEHGIGYQFESGKVMRVDSEFLHQEVVKPALRLLQAAHFAGAEKEFHKAHKHYRDQEYEDTISESLKALESTLKVICERKGWPFSEEYTASRLIQTVFDHELLPNYLQSEFSGLRTILEGGVPAIRNRNSGHGTGATPRQVPAHLAEYALHMTASAIVFLTEAAGD